MIDFSKCPIDVPWQLVDPEGNIQMINSELQLNYARLQIAKNRLKGYRLINLKGDKKCEINEHGKVDDWEEDLFQSSTNLSVEILKIGVDRWNEQAGARKKAYQIKKEFCLSERPKAIMKTLGFEYDGSKSLATNCKNFLREKEECDELYQVWNAMHPDELIRCL